MTQSSLQNVLTFARRLAGAQETNQLADSTLLEQFAENNDQRSFALLIERHGPMVWASCHRVLDSISDVEDCFQATFLVLARKAGSLKRGEALGGWLHRVAYRLSMHCRLSAGKRRRKELGAALMTVTKEEPRESWDEIRLALDRELEQLPRIYRVVLVLCYLEGKTQAQAAKELGCQVGTIKGRVVRGKVLLRRRLEKRGLNLGATALAALLAEQSTSAAVPGLLMAATTTAAARFALGKTAGVSGSAVVLADAFLRAANLGNLLKSVMVVAGLILATGGGSLLAQPAWRSWPEENELRFVATGHVTAPASNKGLEKFDQYGDPLPPNAISRLGSIRYRLADEPRALLMTPDGKQVISEGVDGIRHWDISTGKELQALTWGAAPGMDSSRSFTADRRRFVATSEAGQLGIYEVKSGTKLQHLGDGQYYLPAFSADGRYVAAFRGESPNEIELFDATSGNCLWKCARYSDHVRKLVFTPDCKRLVFSGCNLPIKDLKVSANGIFILDSATGQELRKIEFGSDQVADVAISPDSKEVAVVFFALPGSPKETLRIWDLSTSKLRLQIQPPPKPADVSGTYFFAKAYFAARGNILVTTIANHDQLSILDLTTGAEIKRIGKGLHNVSGMTETLDGKTLIVNGDGRICLLDMETGRDAVQHLADTASTLAIRFVDDNETILLSNGNLTDYSTGISYWDAKTGKKLQQKNISKRPVEQLLGEDAALIIDYGQNPIRPYLEILSTGKTSNLSPTFELNPGCYWAASTNGRFVAVGHTDEESINLFDGKTGVRIRVFRTVGLTTNRLQFSADETLLFAFSPNQKTRIWDVSTGRQLADYMPQKVTGDHFWPTGRPHGALVPPRRVNEEPHYDIALSPDGKRIASTDFREYLLIRDAPDGKHQVRIDTGQARPSQMWFSSDNKRLAWSSFDNPEIHILDLQTQREIAVLAGHKGIVNALAFSKDGKKLVSSSSDSTALVWDLEQAVMKTR